MHVSCDIVVKLKVLTIKLKRYVKWTFIFIDRLSRVIIVATTHARFGNSSSKSGHKISISELHYKWESPIETGLTHVL